MKVHQGFQVHIVDMRYGLIFNCSKVYPTYNGALRCLNRLLRSNDDCYTFYSIVLVDK